MMNSTAASYFQKLWQLSGTFHVIDNIIQFITAAQIFKVMTVIKVAGVNQHKNDRNLLATLFLCENDISLLNENVMFFALTSALLFLVLKFVA